LYKLSLLWILTHTMATCLCATAVVKGSQNFLVKPVGGCIPYGVSAPGHNYVTPAFKYDITSESFILYCLNHYRYLPRLPFFLSLSVTLCQGPVLYFQYYTSSPVYLFLYAIVFDRSVCLYDFVFFFVMLL
jgi:hypothetical protein